MKRERADPCLLVQKGQDGKCVGLVLLQVDNSLGIGLNTLLLDEEAASKAFRRKPRVPISAEPTAFKGRKIT